MAKLMASPIKPGVFSVALPPDAKLPPPAGANFFHFTVAGPEIHLLVGCVSFQQLADRHASGKQGTVSPEITHRFLMSALGFAHLKAQIDEIAGSVTTTGEFSVGK